MRAFKFKASLQGAHVRLLVYVGPDLNHLAFSGQLMFDPDEYQDFIFRVLGYRGPMHKVAHEGDVHEWSELTV